MSATMINNTKIKIWAFLVFVLCAFSPPVHAASQALENALLNANRITLEYRNKLKELEQWCESQGLRDEAEQVRLCVPPAEDDKIHIPKLPLKVRTPPQSVTPKTATRKNTKSETTLRNIPPTTKTKESKTTETTETLKTERDWEAELYQLQKEYAQKLFHYAKIVAKNDRGSIAIQMALAALHADSDHPAIRKLLGFVRYQDEWRTPWEAQQLRKGRIDHPQFGWIPEKNVERYEKGERLVGKKWISEQEDVQNRKDIRKGWPIESEHYLLLTNHSVEEGVRATRKLEDLYRAWKLLFYRYMASDEELATLFEGRGTPKPLAKRHQVWLFRDRDDYVKALSPSQPFAKHTLGFYTTISYRCYFFSVDPQATREEKEDVDRTLLHEATHQLFAESRRTKPTAGNRYNFWILEGIAMYMETLSSSGTYYTIGGTDDIRFQNAVDVAVSRKFYVPFGTMTKIGREPFQSVDMRMLTAFYAQSAGWAHFLMHAENGEYRDATVFYLRLIYNEEDNAQTLQKLTKVPYEDLDKKYLEYLKMNSGQ